MKKTEKKISQLYNSGLSVNQISEKLGITASRIRYFMKKSLIICRNHSDASKLLHMTKFGKKQFQIKKNLTVEEENLRVAGIMLYWGEGTKMGNSVVFSNSDPQMIVLFLAFLRTVCGIDENRLHLLLHVYDDQNEMQLKSFWSRITNIPINQFSKTFVHHGKTGSYKKVSKFGTISLRYSDKELLRVINDWIDKFCLPM
ncbi:MAG: hypothetical protein NTY30_03025 [Candidatus Berkelbacteria bacterium]|nr:hypothetical protein [Candidatus Berkelbacteria bacterium]